MSQEVLLIYDKSGSEKISQFAEVVRDAQHSSAQTGRLTPEP
jgi:hypothetical protein